MKALLVTQPYHYRIISFIRSVASFAPEAEVAARSTQPSLCIERCYVDFVVVQAKG